MGTELRKILLSDAVTHPLGHGWRELVQKYPIAVYKAGYTANCGAIFRRHLHVTGTWRDAWRRQPSAAASARKPARRAGQSRLPAAGTQSSA